MECEFLIDSGAMVNTFTKALFDRLRGDPVLGKGLLNVNDRADIPLKAYASQGNTNKTEKEIKQSNGNVF